MIIDVKRTTNFSFFIEDESWNLASEDARLFYVQLYAENEQLEESEFTYKKQDNAEIPF